MENILIKITETETTAITDTHLEAFLTHLKSAGRAPSAVFQYSRTLRSLRSWLSGRPLTPELLMEWKTHPDRLFPHFVGKVSDAICPDGVLKVIWLNESRSQ